MWRCDQSYNWLLSVRKPQEAPICLVVRFCDARLMSEKQIKAWTRAKRLALIKTMNPTWQDLAEGWGEATKLQVLHFVRDDNIEREDDSEGVEGKNSLGKKGNSGDQKPRQQSPSRNTA